MQDARFDTMVGAILPYVDDPLFQHFNIQHATYNKKPNDVRDSNAIANEFLSEANLNMFSVSNGLRGAELSKHVLPRMCCKCRYREIVFPRRFLVLE